MLASHLDAYISRYGDFCANDNNDNDDTTLPLVHASTADLTIIRSTHSINAVRPAH